MEARAKEKEKAPSQAAPESGPALPKHMRVALEQQREGARHCSEMPFEGNSEKRAPRGQRRGRTSAGATLRLGGQCICGRG